MSGLPDLQIPKPASGKNPNRSEPGRWPSGPTTDVADYTAEEDEFVRAVAHFRTVNKISCPTLCQLLWVARQLGHRKGSSWAGR